jgi:muramoyltetrapeptide carboxypeptidase
VTTSLTTLRKPTALRAGDRVAVLAPASPFTREDFDRGIEEVKALGFVPVYDERVFARRGFVAGEPAARAAAFLGAWEDPTIAGVLCVRGGYGSVQILPFLTLPRVQATPKVFVGYSDVTSMLTWLTLHGGIVTFHGPMLAGRMSLGADGYDRTSFMRAVTNTEEPIGELPIGHLEIVRPGDARGVLLGGTLTQLLASFNTPYAFDPPPGHILFIDEVGERPYRLDRMLTQLRLSGLLSRAAGVIFGELPGCDEPGGNITARDVVRDLMRDFRGPVILGLPSGHTTSPALTLPFGIEATVEAATTPRIVIEEAAVL